MPRGERGRDINQPAQTAVHVPYLVPSDEPVRHKQCASRVPKHLSQR